MTKLMNKGSHADGAIRSGSEARRPKVKGLRLGILVSKIDTMADIRTGRFRKMFDRNARAYGTI